MKTRTKTTWTVTSPNGQGLNAEIDSACGDAVILSSAAGNHSTISQADWAEKLSKMKAAGFRVDVKYDTVTYS